MHCYAMSSASNPKLTPFFAFVQFILHVIVHEIQQLVMISIILVTFQVVLLPFLLQVIS